VYPQAVVTADFNHDGRLDPATANGDNTVSVLLGNGDGTFQAALSSGAGYQPRFVTALGATDVLDGWRTDKAHGGCVIDVPSGEFVARGLSMPHSPRWHDGRLFALESGTGGVVLVDRATGRCDTVARLDGFTRGLAIAGPYAFVGLSKIRATSAMDGVALAARRDRLRCGVGVIDLRSGQAVASLTFQTAVEEVFDVRLLPGVRFPEVVGFQKETLLHTFVIPRPSQKTTG
jgi:uncharacterized protein (TIGR03032 family)